MTRKYFNKADSGLDILTEIKTSFKIQKEKVDKDIIYYNI